MDVFTLQRLDFAREPLHDVLAFHEPATLLFSTRGNDAQQEPFHLLQIAHVSCEINAESVPFVGVIVPRVSLDACPEVREADALQLIALQQQVDSNYPSDVSPHDLLIFAAAARDTLSS